MKARGTVLKWAAVSGALDDLPLDALLATASYPEIEEAASAWGALAGTPRKVAVTRSPRRHTRGSVRRR